MSDPSEKVVSVREDTITHYLDGQRIAVSFLNGHEVRMKVVDEMKKDIEEFYQVNRVQI